MEPVRGGKLAEVDSDIEEMFKKARPNNSVASWAMSFVASYSNVLTVLSGMNTIEQLEDNISTFTDFTPFTESEYKVCENACAMLNKSEVIPCTGCDYCADCPQGIKISTIFDIYNQFKKSEISKDEAVNLYSKIDVNASACVNCGKCASHCPQSIDIPDKMNNLIPEFFK